MHRIYSRNKPQPVTGTQPRARRAFCLLCTFPFQPDKDDFVLGLLFLCFSYQIAERKRSYAQIPPPQTTCPLSTTKTKNKAISLPLRFCSSVTPGDEGHSHNCFCLLSDRKHKPNFPETLVAGSQVPQGQDVILA